MKEIILTQNKVSFINDEFYNEINKYKWYAYKNRNTYYARRNEYENGKHYIIMMHNIIWKLMGNFIPEGMMLDHANHDGLNNQNNNLRLATQSQNSINSRKNKDSTTGYIGVRKLEPNRYQARIGFNYKRENLGTLRTAEMAARVYDYNAIRLFGEFAVLNFPDSRELYKF